MFEKKAIMIFKWNEILGYDECTEALLKSLEGKPVVIYVAGAKQKPPHHRSCHPQSTALLVPSCACTGSGGGHLSGGKQASSVVRLRNTQ